ncbi:MAG: stage II sporulation protein R [Clostridia bacterium]|nr:stage II sporulation protein R [Clostridia bacterium]
MKKRILLAAGLFASFITLLIITCFWAEEPAKQVRDSVLRFHIVANSDSETDQQNKLAVRDGIASLCAALFKPSDSKTESMQIAAENASVIENAAKDILAERGSEDNVTVSIRKRFFPTRHYDGVSLPAGVYDTIDVQIGAAEGRNFWCVMFPEICIGSSLDKNQEKMSEVLTDDAAELVTENKPTVRFKFKIIEIIENIRNKIKK